MIEDFTKDLLERLSNEIRKEENKEKLNAEVISPLMESVLNMLYPWLTLLSILYCILLFLIVVILYQLIVSKK